MYQPITYSLLKSKHACQPQLDLVETHFGKINPIPLTTEIAIRFCVLFDINWAARNLLTPEDYEEYLIVKAPAWEEYNKVNETALEEYKKVNETALEKYYKFNGIDYNEYKTIISHATEEYNKAKATEFVKIYKQGMK